MTKPTHKGSSRSRKKPDMANKPLQLIKRRREESWDMANGDDKKVKHSHTEAHFCGTDYKVESEKLLGRKICLVHTQEKVEQKKINCS